MRRVSPPALGRCRRAVLSALALALVLLVAGCGSAGSGGDSGTPAADAVTVSGALGEAPRVDIPDTLAVDGLSTRVVASGEGPTLSSGESVLVHLWIGSASSGATVYSTFGQGPQLLTLGSRVIPAVARAVEGQQVGSRVLAVAPPAKAFGERGNPQLGLGAQDDVVFVIDLVAPVLPGPRGTPHDPPPGTPTVRTSGGTVQGLDFRSADQPDGELHTTVLIEGKGPVVRQGQTVAVNYLGVVHGAQQPFDSSYSRGRPSTFPIGQRAVIEGWDRAIVGARVGSRLLVEIPPRLGYGAQGNPQAGISGTDTLYFVIDILGAA